MATEKTTTKATRTTKATKAKQPFDLSKYREIERYVRREIPREHGDPLRVKLRSLSMRMVDDISFTMETPLSEIFEAIAPFVAEWDLTAKDTQTGKEVPVPSPAEVGPAVFELLETAEAVQIIMWLTHPAQMPTFRRLQTAGESPGHEPTPLVTA